MADDIENLDTQDSGFANAFDEAEGTVEEQTEDLTEETPDDSTDDAVDDEVTEEKSEEKKSDEDGFEHKYKTLQGIHKSDKEKFEKKIKDLEKEKEDLISQIPTKSEKKDEETPTSYLDFLTDAQKEELAEYEQDFAQVAKMEGVKRDLALDALRKEFLKFKDEILDQLLPATKLLGEIDEDRKVRSEDEHFDAIKTAHGDYEKYIDDGSLLKWIETKPNYIRKGMKETYDKGTAEDIIDLLTDFKEEAGIKETETPNPELDSKKSALRSVPKKRTPVNLTGVKADDFEGAFDEAVNASEG